MSFFYLIGHFGTCKYRRLGLLSVLDSLQSLRPTLKIVLAISSNNLDLVLEEKYRRLIDHSILLQKKHQSRSSALNRCADFVKLHLKNQISDSAFLWFADADIVLRDRKDILIHKPDTQHVVVRPFSSLIDAPEPQTDSIAKKRLGMSFCSGIVGMSLATWINVDGWDENYQRWGYEDAAMDVRLHRYSKINKEICFVIESQFADHYWHPVVKFDANRTNEKYFQEKYGSEHRQSVPALCFSLPQRKIPGYSATMLDRN